jgi:acyl-homoserine lactone synthase
MLHLINAKNRDLPLQQRLLEASYRVRHEQYVKGRGWKALDRPDGRECDQFDTPDATYLLWADGEDVLGGARFVPTDKPHLMSEIFPHIVSLGPVPRSAHIWELTRLFSSRDGESAVNRRQVTGDVFSGMFEMALHYRLRAISIVCDTFFVTRFLNMGLEVDPLGAPSRYDEGMCIAVTLPVNVRQLSIARGPSRGTVLFEVPMPGVGRPYAEPRPAIHVAH